MQAGKLVILKGRCFMNPQEIITGINKSLWSAQSNIYTVIARHTSTTSAALPSVSASWTVTKERATGVITKIIIIIIIIIIKININLFYSKHVLYWDILKLLFHIWVLFIYLYYKYLFCLSMVSLYVQVMFKFSYLKCQINVQ